MNILLSGALGRMGQAVIRQSQARGDRVTAGVDIAWQNQPSPFPMAASFESVSAPADVIIDFSRPACLPGLLEYAQAHRLPAVLAATGYPPEAMAAIREAARHIPLFQSANMSLGIHVLKKLVAQAAALLGESFDVEIVETHHNQKADAPSGTALALYHTLESVYGPPREQVNGRSGPACKRKPQEIGIHALRGGTVPGIHEVGFYGADEIITLTHTAQSRDIFALGALKAAAFLLNQPAGLYGMDELMGS